MFRTSRFMSHVCRNLLQNVPTLGNLSILNPKQIIDGDRLVAPCPFYDTFTEEMLQGDGWRGFQLFMFASGDRRSVRGLVLSNSCDVDPDNPRDVPARMVFAPLAKLSVYEDLLRRSGIAEARVDDKVASIKSQKTTNIFYLPASGPLDEDYVVRLDDAHSMPVAAHTAAGDREKLFTLSNTGFYMLVFKLSVHFCRLHEKENRKTRRCLT